MRTSAIDSKPVEMFVEGSALEFGQIEGNGAGSICILAIELMALQMIDRQLYQVFRWRLGAVWKYLREDVVAKLLYTNFIVSRRRRHWYCAVSCQ